MPDETVILYRGPIPDETGDCVKGSILTIPDETVEGGDNRVCASTTLLI